MVIDFYATWCGPCVLLAPQLEEAASHYDGRVRFLKIDTDENEALASSMKVPSCMLLDEDLNIRIFKDEYFACANHS